jgi:hypothetical protein
MRLCVTYTCAKAYRRIEAYHSLLKREWVQLERINYESILDVTESIGRYNTLYNHDRETLVKENQKLHKHPFNRGTDLGKAPDVRVFLLSLWHVKIRLNVAKKSYNAMNLSDNHTHSAEPYNFCPDH